MENRQKYEKLFQPGRLGNLVVRNRLMMAPMNLGFTEYPYNFSRQYIDCIEERARGGVGAVITAHVKAESKIDPYPVGGMLACLDRESYLKNFAEVAEAAHRYGSKIIIQLSAGTGRLADQPLAENWPASPSPLPILNKPGLVTRELTQGEIAGLVEAYGKAAERAKRAGYDAIMVHCAGSYLIGQFLSSKWNQRTDRYGGSLEARMRFMEECIASVRSLVGPDFPLLAVISTDSKIEGAPPIEDAEAVARRLKELGILALLPRTGSYDSKDWVIPPVYFPPACRVPYTQPIKEAVELPIILDGRIDSPELAESLLEEGKADYIALGRPLLADPEWPKKAEQGRAEEIRGCIYCNECYTRVTSRRYAKCALNPELGREKEYRSRRADQTKTVVVVGGGPGGMRAATVAARRGHRVTLYEKTAKLGGNLKAASAPQFKLPVRPLIDWLEREVHRAGVTVKLGEAAGAATIKEIEPDAVVLATGSVPLVPDIAGVKGENVVTAIDVLLGRVPAGGETIVIGGGYVGCETALYLAQMGKKITIVEMLPDIALDAAAIERESLVRLINETGIKLATGMKAGKITESGVTAVDASGQTHILGSSSVVIATGMQADNVLYGELQGTVPELYQIGDAVQPRRVFDAIHEGETAAYLL